MIYHPRLLASCLRPLLPVLFLLIAAPAEGQFRAVPARNVFILDDSTFDSWLFSSMSGNMGNYQGQGIKAALADLASSRLAKLEMSCELSDDQRRRLKLASLDDAAEFEAEVEAVRRELVGKSFPQNDISVPYQQIQELAMRLQEDFYGDGSLFQKVSQHILTPEQRNAIEKAEAERRRRRHEAAAGTLIVGLQRYTPMTAQQRDAFHKLIVEQTEPALRSSQYDRYVLLYQVSTLPENDLKAIFDEAQLRSLTPAFRNGKAYKSMLEQQGLIATDDK